MKTKTCLLLCLLIGIGLTQLSAQTKTVVTKGSGEGVWELPVYCIENGQEVDRVVMGIYLFQSQVHYIDGIPVWGGGKMFGECYSKKTDEVFTYKEIDQRNVWSGNTYTLHYNLNGNQGNHYIGILTVEYSDALLILHPDVIQARCVENGKK